MSYGDFSMGGRVIGYFRPKSAQFQQSRYNRRMMLNPMSSAVLGKRIMVVGTSSSGKTTLAKQLSSHLGYPHVELDALNWDPDWTESPDFAQRVDEQTRSDTWVSCGNYSRVRHILWERADTAVWLDYPLWLNYWRLTKRMFRRVMLREELWNGNRESLRMMLSKDSLYVWIWQTHARRRREYGAIIANNETPTISWIHLQSPRQTNAWLRSVHT